MREFDQACALAQSALPLFPPEVFELWLNDRIKQNGWPPSGLEWEGYLFGESLEFWGQLKWSKEKVALSFGALSATSRQTAELLYEASVLKRNNIMSRYLPNTRERFASVMAYALEHQVLPGTLVLLKRYDLYDVVDGNHRVAALLGIQSIQGHPDVPAISEVEAWVASSD